jgi:hypothetical protein
LIVVQTNTLLKPTEIMIHNGIRDSVPLYLFVSLRWIGLVWLAGLICRQIPRQLLCLLGCFRGSSLSLLRRASRVWRRWNLRLPRLQSNCQRRCQGSHTQNVK